MTAKRTKAGATRRKFTESVVRSLPPGSLVWDSFLPGFGIRVGARSRTWIAACVRPGTKHPVRLKLGTFPEMSLADARDAARQLMNGGAPQALVLFGDLVQQFLEDGRTRSGSPLRPASLKAYASMLNVSAKPLHARPVHAIKRGDIAMLTRRIATTTGPAHARLAKATLSRFWSWLAESDLADSNPVAGSPRYAVPARSRAFSDAEIKALWFAAVEPDLALVLRLLLWTGARETEIGGMRHSELTREARGLIWILPGQRAKNHKKLILPLARQTAAALDDWPIIVNRDPLFGLHSRDGFTGWSRAKTQLDALLRFNEPWQFRDCRRTVETGMAALGIPKDIVNRLLNHGVPAMAAIYDQHHYFDEKAAALQKWADHLDVITGASIC